MTNRQEKILGGLLGAAVGDAMGAATEFRNAAMIKEHFGGLVTDFVQPPDDNLAKGTRAGMVTDDFSIAYFTARRMLEENSPITNELAVKALIEWAEHPEYTRYIGPTTKNSIAKLKGEALEKNILPELGRLLCDNSRATNGGGMKSGVMGLFHPGDLDGAIDDAIVMCMPTHDNTIALSGACAIAAATAKAMEERVSYIEVIEAGIYGAREGYRKAQPIAKPVAGASVEKKIGLAVEIGLRKAEDFEGAMNEIADIIGGGLYAYEAIPAAFGHIAACGGRVMDSILMGVNAGDDTDTVACMTGFIVGALGGAGLIAGR